MGSFGEQRNNATQHPLIGVCCSVARNSMYVAQHVALNVSEANEKQQKAQHRDKSVTLA